MILTKTIVKLLGTICLVVVSSKAYSQKRLELKNISTNKVRVIKENDKITVHTKAFKISGKIKIIDNKTILVKNKNIKIDDIIKINTKTQKLKP